MLKFAFKTKDKETFLDSSVENEDNRLISPVFVQFNEIINRDQLPTGLSKMIVSLLNDEELVKRITSNEEFINVVNGVNDMQLFLNSNIKSITMDPNSPSLLKNNKTLLHRYSDKIDTSVKASSKELGQKMVIKERIEEILLLQQSPEELTTTEMRDYVFQPIKINGINNKQTTKGLSSLLSSDFASSSNCLDEGHKPRPEDVVVRSRHVHKNIIDASSNATPFCSDCGSKNILDGEIKRAKHGHAASPPRHQKSYMENVNSNNNSKEKEEKEKNSDKENTRRVINGIVFAVAIIVLLAGSFMEAGKPNVATKIVTSYLPDLVTLYSSVESEIRQSF